MAVDLSPGALRERARREIRRRQAMVAQKDGAEKDLLAFVRMVWPVLEPEIPLVEGWVLDLLCDVLMAVTDGDMIRVSINVPPGSTKSTLLNILWPAWEWGPRNRPSLRYLSVSYSTAVPIRDNLRFMRLIKHPVYQACWGDRVKLIREGAEWVGNDKTGFKMVTSTGGGTTGFRGDRILCLPSESHILTDAGLLSVGDIVREKRPVRVAGWSGSAIEWQQIEAYETNPPGRLVAIDYGTGVLRCTDGHPVWVEGRGYVPAITVRPGDEVVGTQEVGEHSALRRVRDAVLSLPTPPGADSMECLRPRMRRETPDGAAQPGICHREAADHMRMVRHGETLQRSRGGAGQNVLQVLRCATEVGQQRQEVAGRIVLRVRQDIRAAQPPVEILLSAMQGYGPQSEHGGEKEPPIPDGCYELADRLVCGDEAGLSSGVLGMLRRFQAAKQAIEILLQRMQAAFACGSRNWNAKRSVRAWEGQFPISAEMDAPAEGCHSEAGRVPMRPVRKERGGQRTEAGRAPHRLCEREPSGDEPDIALSEMPREDAREAGPTFGLVCRTVRSVEVESGFEAVTYNLRVGPHHNYFADGLLTHNCDDANNPIDVESDTVRNTTVKFLREVMPDRLNDLSRSAIINLQQRTHENDATGTLLEHGQGYQFVCIPMEFDPLRICEVTLHPEMEVKNEETGEIEVIPADVWIDPRSLDGNGKQLKGLYYKPGGALAVRDGSPMAKAEGESCWPERFPEDALSALKLEKGPYAWSAQYNQVPGVRGGAIIMRDWWKPWLQDAYPELGTVVVSVDTAVEEGETNDYNACTVWGAFAGQEGEPLFLLLDAWRERMPLAKLVEKIATTCRQRRADYLLVEHKTRGRDVHDEIVRLYQSQQWQTILVRPEGDKVSRLRAVSHLFSGDVRRDPVTEMDVWSGGVVYAPDKTWAEDVIAEVSAFPYSAHDDWVDTVSQALGWVRRNGVILRKAEFDEQELERNKFRKNPGVPYMIRSGA